MKHQQGYIKTLGSANIFHQCWLPEEPPKAILLVVHGLAEHSGRYMNLVNYFLPKGYAVYALDHLGHGKSDGQRVYVEKFQDYVATVKTFVNRVKEEQPDTPLFMIGHSMGGLIAAAFLMDYQRDLSGAVLSSPGIKVPDSLSQALIFAGKILSIFMPRTGVSQLDARGISRDPAVVEAFVNDPLVYKGKVTARLGGEMLKTMNQVIKQATAITLPLLIAQAGNDTLVDPLGAQLLHDRVGSKDKTLKIYKGLFHEIFNEPEHLQVLEDVHLWLKDHLPQP